MNRGTFLKITESRIDVYPFTRVVESSPTGDVTPFLDSRCGVMVPPRVHALSLDNVSGRQIWHRSLNPQK